jgi:hypothetical protein
LIQSRLKIRKGRECVGCGERGRRLFLIIMIFSLEKTPSCLLPPALCLLPL